MTEMRRVTISVTEEQDTAILNMKKDDHFVRCSYSEIVRQILDIGLKAISENRKIEINVDGRNIMKAALEAIRDKSEGSTSQCGSIAE